jgi:subtilisin family serine protease
VSSSSIRRALCGTLAVALLPWAAGSASADETAPSAPAAGLTPAQVEQEVEETGNPVVALVQAGDTLRVRTIDADSPEEAREAAEDLRRDDDVVSIGVDQRVHSLAGDARPYAGRSSASAVTPNYQLSITGARQAWGLGTRTVKVAVLDTGVFAQHPELAGRVLSGREFLREGPRTGKPGTADDDGHGTHVAGIIGAVNNDQGSPVDGFAQRVQILPVKVLNQGGEGWVSDSTRGIIWAADQGAKVINLSLGSERGDVNLRKAIRYARSKGAAVVAAAGNEGGRAKTAYPAAYPETISVGGTTRADYWASFSSVRNDVDISAPGDQIVSLAPAWTEYEYAVMSGTSMAAPAVSGSIASLMSTGITPGQAYSALVASAKDIAGGRQGLAYGADPFTGVGRIDVGAATKPVVSFVGPVGRTYTAGSTARMQVRVSHLGRPLANRAVRIRTSTGRTANVRTGRTGQAAFNVPLIHGTTIEARTSGIAARRTTFNRVQPNARVKLKKYKASSRRTYRKVRLTVARPARQKVVVQVRTGGRWKTVKKTRLTSSSRVKTYSWKVNARSKAKRTLRVKIYAGGGLISRTLTVTG